MPLPPLADLHRHLDGSLRESTLRELAARLEIDVPAQFRFRPGMGLAAALRCFDLSLADARRRTLEHVVTDLFPAGGEESGALGKPPQPPYPRVSALRLDGVPWQYPFVPLKLGSFQQLRESMLAGQPYEAHGWLVARQNPMLSLPDRGRTQQTFAKMDFIVTIDIIMNDTAWYSDVVLPEDLPRAPTASGLRLRRARFVDTLEHL